MSHDSSLKYGWLSSRPGFLQCLNTPRWFLFCLCQYFFSQSVIVNGVFPASISTIERRFGYSSSMMGLLTGTYDIAALLFSPIVGYLGETRRKPLWCSCGLFLMGIGFFVFLIPHLIIGPYKAGAAKISVSNLCGLAANLSNATSMNGCGGDDTSNIGLYVIFFLGMFLIGTGATPMVVLAFPYMDENLPPKVVPMYMGFFYAAGILGLLAGSVLASVFLSIYVDFGTSTFLTVDDERWVGAWWLGFAIFTGLAVFWSFWMMGFPKEFPGTKAIREALNETGNKKVVSSTNARYVKISQIFKATKHLFAYPSFICMTIAICAEESLVAAISAFMPKIIQSQLQFTASTASILFGIIAGVAALTGSLLGAYINKKLKLDCTGAVRMCFIVSVFSLLATVPTFISCDNTQLAGVNSPYPNSTTPTGLIASCNEKCGCVETMQYRPVCGTDSLTYFSPCHAGCRIGAVKNNTLMDCSCVAGRGSTTWSGGESQRGVCQTECGARTVIFLVVVFLVAFFTFLNNIPASFVILRCVPVDQRSYAIGIHWDFVRLLGTIPGPIIFGYVIDQACILWDYRCGQRGSCLAYSNYHLGLALLFLCFICKVFSISSFALSWFFCRRQFREKEEVDGKQEVETEALDGKQDVEDHDEQDTTKF